MDQSHTPSQWAKVVGDEHQNLERLLAELDDVVANNHAKSAGFSVLNQIVEFCTAHIHHEESLIRIVRHDHADRHVADHSRILDILAGALANCERAGEIEWASFCNTLKVMYERHKNDFDQPLLDAVSKVRNES
ncbi:MAG: hemerythrin domain-containing protein [Rhodospirillaceae bacterium]